MPSLLLHLAAVERLSAQKGDLPEEIARALDEDIEYARFGAALASLPDFEGVFGLGGVRHLWIDREPHRFSRLFHAAAPIGFGLKVAELVANGALVGTEAGLAFVSGYFSHVCVDRGLRPLTEKLVAKERRHGESGRAALRRVEWAQAVTYVEACYGADVLGHPGIRRHLQIHKRQGVPVRGVGRGLFELVRLASQETLGEAPTKAQVDDWVRGLYTASLVMSTPAVRATMLWRGSAHAVVLRGPDVDLMAEVDQSLAAARTMLIQLARLIRLGRFTPRSRQKFLESFPEGGIEACLA